MNKKIFTLLACTLVLFMTAFGSYAQPWKGRAVQSVADKARDRAYHLKVSALGDQKIAENDYQPNTGLFLAMDSLGRLVFRDGAYIFRTDGEDRGYSALVRLNETLWCIGSEKFTDSHGAQFTFLNKHYGTELSVNTDIGTPTKPEVLFSPTTHWNSKSPNSDLPAAEQTINDSIRVYEYPDGDEAVWLGGNVAQWLAGSTYVDAVADTFALRIPLSGNINRGWYLTLAVKDKNTTGSPAAGTTWNDLGLYLAIVHNNDFDPGSPFYKDHLVRFSLHETVPRLLTAAGINELLKDGNGIKLTADFPLAAGEKDLFSTVTSAVKINSYYIGRTPVDNPNGIESGYGANDDPIEDDPYYVRLVTPTGTIYVKDGTAPENYYTGTGRIYPKIDVTTTADAANRRGRADFRLVYYPSSGTVVINVRQLRIAEVLATPGEDDGIEGEFYSDEITYTMAPDYVGTAAVPHHPWGTTTATWNDFYSYSDHTHLFVQAQRIEANSHVITAGGSTGSVSSLANQFEIGTGTKGCSVADTRASVAEDLYLIRDATGDYYLTVPLYTGTFSPQWEKLAREDALNSPASHWFVQKYDGSEKSKLKLTNREFANITFEYVQIYNEDKAFKSTWINTAQEQGKAGYGTNVGAKEVSVSGFQRIEGREYRQNPYLGYRNIATDGESLAAGSYTLEYYNYAAVNNPFYIGLTPAPTTDTVFRAVQSSQKTVFKLKATDIQENEPYGIKADSLYALAGFGPSSRPNPDSIVQLVRTCYGLQISDYLSAVRNDRVVTLANTANYVHATESDAKASSARVANFYLRYQFQQGEKDYYTLLQRLDDSDFKWLAEQTDLTVASTLWSTGDQADTFGVLQVSVHPYALTINAVSRLGTNETPSAFAFVALNDPLYRRFNDEGLGNANPEVPQGDAPRYLRFFRARDAQDGRKDYLYEDQYSQYSYDANGDGTTAAGLGIRFLGMINEVDDRNEIGKDPSHPHNFTFYVDTAFVNRVGFELKPQYLIAVDPRINQLAFPNQCPSCAVEKIDPFTYTYGRYLINAADTAAEAARFYSLPANKDDRKAAAYRYGLYDRLIFVKAVHIGDELYILKDQILHATNGIPDDPLAALKDTLPAQGYVTASGDSYPGGTTYLNFDDLKANSTAVPLNNGGKHSDYVFSFRYAEQTGDAARPFFIESETTNHDRDNGQRYGITRGGWVKYYNGYMVISRRDRTSESITDAELFDVESSSEEATSIKEISTPAGPKVISGTGVVTILNASGKLVVLSNVLGQTVAKTVLTSDRADISAPSGVVIVSVEGLGSVKAIVK